MATNSHELKVDIVDEAKLLLTYPQGAMLVDDSGIHYKFYNIYKDHDGHVHSTWGRIGSRSQSTDHRYINIHSKIKEKLKKGYRVLRSL